MLHNYLFLKLFSCQHTLIPDNTLIDFQKSFQAIKPKLTLNLFSGQDHMKITTLLGKFRKIKDKRG